MKIKDSRLLDAAIALVGVLDKGMDDNLPRKISDIVKFHSKGAAIASVAGGWVPGFGSTVAVTISAGFIWSMYARINDKIKLPLSENILKSVASGIATNIAGYAVGALMLSAAFSLFPGVGTVGAVAIIGATCYALTLASGIVYLKILTKLFKSKKGGISITEASLKQAAKQIMENEDIKAIIKEAKDEYKAEERKQGGAKIE